MTITTTPTIEGQKIEKYLGIVSGITLVAFPGGQKTMTRGWKSGMDEAIADVTEQAEQLKADAVVGFKIEVYKSGMSDNLYYSGTAVKLA